LEKGIVKEWERERARERKREREDKCLFGVIKGYSWFEGFERVGKLEEFFATFVKVSSFATYAAFYRDPVFSDRPRAQRLQGD